MSRYYGVLRQNRPLPLTATTRITLNIVSPTMLGITSIMGRTSIARSMITGTRILITDTGYPWGSASGLASFTTIMMAAFTAAMSIKPSTVEVSTVEVSTVEVSTAAVSMVEVSMAAGIADMSGSGILRCYR